MCCSRVCLQEVELVARMRTALQGPLERAMMQQQLPSEASCCSSDALGAAFTRILTTAGVQAAMQQQVAQLQALSPSEEELRGGSVGQVRACIHGACASWV